MPIITDAERAQVEAIELAMSGFDVDARVRIYDTLLLHARNEQMQAEDEIVGWLGLQLRERRNPFAEPTRIRTDGDDDDASPSD